MKVQSIPFSENIITAALDCICNRCIMVFPTRASAAIAQKQFQPQWQLEEITWTTMEEFKSSLLITDQPRVEDDKRLLALYQVLTEEEKEYFHLSTYGDLVDWGNHFFQFFEELGEAGHSPDYLSSIADQGILYLRYWQEEYIQYVHAICNRYKEFIEALGFTDRIFQTGDQSWDLAPSGYRIVFVNQYYYSALEKELISLLEKQHNDIHILYHGIKPASGEIWEPQELDLKEALQSLPKPLKISIFECSNETQAAMVFLNQDHDASPKDAAIVDSSFYQSSYSALFHPDEFSIPCGLDLASTMYYNYLYVLHKILLAVTKNSGFIPLALVIQNFLEPAMLRILQPDWSAKEISSLRAELFKLSGNEVLYLDLQPDLQLKKHPYTMQLVNALREQLTAISAVDTASALVSQMGKDACFAPEAICTAEELEYTDILPKIWEAAANFTAIGSLGVVTDWSRIFPPAEVAGGILGLWLDFIKPVRLTRIPRESSQPNWEITNLLDCRNREFHTLAFFNMVENVLPSSPAPVWLLNETQRGMIGLKTYKDIRRWERYYFFRLLLCAQKVEIFTHRNLETNIEPSSFIGELLETLGQIGEKLDVQVVHYSPQQLFQHWSKAPESQSDLNLTQSALRTKGSPLPPEFFRLPADPDHDFPAPAEIVCGSYSLSIFSKNAFAWYIQFWRKLDTLNAELIETISPSLAGNIMHEYFARVLRPLSGVAHDLETLAGVFSNTDELRKNLAEVIRSDEFKYKIPKNYNAEFLSSIISDCLVDTLSAFYHEFLTTKLAGRKFKLIPEAKYSSAEENNPKFLAEAEKQDIHYRISIKGRADLRIESDPQKMIIDFKTGNASVEQLIFYEWFYYLLTNPAEHEHLKSLFWMIFDKCKGKETTNETKRSKYMNEITSSLEMCLNEGFWIGVKSADRKWLKEITRSDLYIAGVEDE